MVYVELYFAVMDNDQMSKIRDYVYGIGLKCDINQREGVKVWGDTNKFRNGGMEGLMKLVSELQDNDEAM